MAQHYAALDKYRKSQDGGTHVMCSGVSCAVWMRINLAASNDETMQLKVASS